MKTNVIVGASAVGSTVASLLAERGENVRLVNAEAAAQPIL